MKYKRRTVPVKATAVHGDATPLAASNLVDRAWAIPHADEQGIVQKRAFLHILGIDLGGGKGKKTAVATLRVDAHEGATVIDIAPRTGKPPLYDDALVDLIRGYGDGTLLCLDAPLTLPPCLRCQVPVCPGQEGCVDPAVVAMRRLAGEIAEASEFGGRDARGSRRGKPAVTPYTQRATELYLIAERALVAAGERGAGPREALGQGTGPLTARAAHLVRSIADRYHLNANLIEVAPKLTLEALGLGRPFKKHLHERRHRAEILEALAPTLRFGPGVWREMCVQSDHLFEAVICAYTGFLWARDAWALPSRIQPAVAQGGWIWTPPLAAAATGDPGDEERLAAAQDG